MCSTLTTKINLHLILIFFRYLIITIISLLDDMTVYNQSMIMGGNTLDKRHADFNDELGYIAPPNRKLPPVPGSNYNTCDRIKRGIHYDLLL